MALRRMLGWSDGELMRSDAKPCTRLMRHTAGVFSVGGGLTFWVLCRLHYGLSPFFLLDIYPSLIADLLYLNVSVMQTSKFMLIKNVGCEHSNEQIDICPLVLH